MRLLSFFLCLYLIPAIIFSSGLEISTGGVLISSDYFNSGYTMDFQYNHSMNLLGFQPIVKFSFIQAQGLQRSDLQLHSYHLYTGLKRNLFNPTPRSGITFSILPGLSHTTISTKEASESSIISWIGGSLGYQFKFSEPVKLVADISGNYSLDKSNTLFFGLTLGIELNKGF
jgi:hypothetical protein